MSKDKTYLFYDIETTGLNKCFDQVLQFAAIRTDLELNEIECYNISVKLNPDIIPAPAALITHNISLEDSKAGICEYEAVSKIHQLMNTPGTISLGYNTLGFDDEFLRFSFYRNLLTPYTHQYANNCSRMDIYPMAALYFLYKTEALTWPEINDKTSLKLEHLSAANQLATGDSHDAMVDVIATLELARRLFKYPKMWQYLCSYFDKNSDLARMASFNEALIVDGIFGADNFYQAPVFSLGGHNHYKNQTLWLRLDSAIPESTYVIRKKPGETGLLLPLEGRFVRYLTKERLKIIDNNRSWLKNNPQLLQEIIHYHKEYTYPKVPNVDIDAALYQIGFLSYKEQDMCAAFHAAVGTEHCSVQIEKITNHGLREQAIRVMGRNYPQYLSEHQLAEFEEYLSHVWTKHVGTEQCSVLIDYKNQPRLTSDIALKQIAELRETRQLNQTQQQLLESLEQYITFFQ